MFAFFKKCIPYPWIVFSIKDLAFYFKAPRIWKLMVDTPCFIIRIWTIEFKREKCFNSDKLYEVEG